MLIATKVLHYYDFVYGQIEFLRQFFLSPRAYISLFEIKMENSRCQFCHFVIPPIVIFQKNRPNIKIDFCWIFFRIIKCTHVSVKNLEWQVSSPKNIATVWLYFCRYPCETPCIIEAAAILVHQSDLGSILTLRLIKSPSVQSPFEFFYFHLVNKAKTIYKI